MISEKFEGYTIEALPLKTLNDKWSVSTKIKKIRNNIVNEKRFFAEDKIYYILEIEAAKECINLGKNLIKKNLVGF